MKNGMIANFLTVIFASCLLACSTFKCSTEDQQAQDNKDAITQTEPTDESKHDNKHFAEPLIEYDFCAYTDQSDFCSRTFANQTEQNTESNSTANLIADVSNYPIWESSRVYLQLNVNLTHGVIPGASPCQTGFTVHSTLDICNSSKSRCLGAGSNNDIRGYWMGCGMVYGTFNGELYYFLSADQLAFIQTLSAEEGILFVYSWSVIGDNALAEIIPQASYTYIEFTSSSHDLFSLKIMEPERADVNNGRIDTVFKTKDELSSALSSTISIPGAISVQEPYYCTLRFNYVLESHGASFSTSSPWFRAPWMEWPKETLNINSGSSSLLQFLKQNAGNNKIDLSIGWSIESNCHYVFTPTDTPKLYLYQERN